jgi:hypothetical protein
MNWKNTEYDSLKNILKNESLKHLFETNHGRESIFDKYQIRDSLQTAFHKLKSVFFELPHEIRTAWHTSDPLKGSVAKRMNMFLRIIREAEDLNTPICYNIYK